jgi:murein DD-endopeptidase MepM/ murein hydrolase activator NlpD
LRPSPYRAPGGSRFTLHVAIVALLAAAVFATTAFSAALPDELAGRPSIVAGGMIAGAASAPVTNDFAHSSAEALAVSDSLHAQASSGDSLLLAVLSLEAAKTTADVAASQQRIVDLGLPQTALAQSRPTELPSESDEDSADQAADTDDREDAGAVDDEPACRDSGNPAYCVYTVVEGDTLSGIAQALGFTGNAGVSAAEMLAQSNQPDVFSSDHIEPGQNIRVPSETGILHTVFADETASDLSADYGASLDAILSSPYNAIGGDGVLVTGQEIFIPDPTQLPVNEEVELTIEEPATTEETPAEGSPTETEAEPMPTDTPAEPTPSEPPAEPTPTEEPVTVPDVPLLGPLTTPTPTPEPTEEPTQTPEADEDAEEEDESPAPDSDRQAGGPFIWPVQGPISSYFGPSHPLGIDIDLFDNPDAPIVASRAGRVVFAGGDPCCSYGLYVVLEHENGIRTLYAHLSEILVSEGDVLDQGDVLGRGGRTGYATGNHLHFEIRVDGNVVDPLRYLP